MSNNFHVGIPEADLPVKKPRGAARVRYVEDGKSYSSAMPDVIAASALVQDAIDGIVENAESEIRNAIKSMGYLPPVAFASGLNVDSNIFTVTYAGVTYAPVADAIPFTTTGTFNPAQWRVVQGDFNLRSDLADPADGAGLVAFRQQAAGAVTRNAKDKIGDRVTPADFGVVGDGVADDTNAWQAYLSACAGREIVSDRPITSLITDTLSIQQSRVPGASAILNTRIDLGNVVFMYAGPRDRVVLQIGNGAQAIPETTIVLPSIVATGAVQWPASLLGTDTAIRIRGAYRCTFREGFVYGFSKGIEYVGCSYNTIFGRHLNCNKYGRIFTTSADETVLGFTNENTVIGGRIGTDSTANALGDAYGQVISWDHVASYRAQNSNRFHDVCFEMGNPASATYRVPVLMDGAGEQCVFYNARHEIGKGPFAICDAGWQGGTGATRASGNLFGVIYNLGSVGTQINRLLQVNGACGNILRHYNSSEPAWSSGSIGAKLRTAGAAGRAYLTGPDLFFFDGFTASKTSGSGYSLAAHSRGAIIDTNSRIAVAVDTSIIKTFRVMRAVQGQFVGRIHIFAFDADGNPLSGQVTDTWGTEGYVKACYPTIGAGSPVLTPSGSFYRTDSDSPATQDLLITVRGEVHRIYICMAAGTGPQVILGFDVVAYPEDQAPGSSVFANDGLVGLHIARPVPDAGDVVLASANPGTQGTAGYYARGSRVANSVAATGVPGGWVCASAGWLAPAWAPSTAYKCPGQLATNDSGKVYELVTAGTSAAAVGPTGTGSGITDGTCIWRYLSPRATFVAEPNLV